MKRSILQLAGIFLVLSLILSSCEKDPLEPSDLLDREYASELALRWNRLFLDAERYTGGYRPPVSARASGYIGLVAYEAILHGSEGRYKSLSPVPLPLPDPDQSYDWEVVLHAAYETAFFHFFPTMPAEQQFRTREHVTSYKSKMQERVGPNEYFRSHEYGQRVANLILNWAAEDSWGHSAYQRNSDPAYIPPTGPAMWQPTYPDYSPALLPHWGKVRTFAALPEDRVTPPLPFSTDPGSELYQQAESVMNLVNEIKAGQHAEDKWIAEFWSDDCPILTFTPSGRFISIAIQLVEAEQLDLFDAVYVFAKTGMALADAGIKSWEGKYEYNYLRPIDYIRKHLGDTSWNTIMCPDGSGNFFTPNFPAYPSGHATFAAAACTVFADIFGENYVFTDNSHEGRTEFNGRPRTYRNFLEMARENAYSRIPIGVHFQMDADAGTELGITIGQRVNDLPWK